MNECEDFAIVSVIETKKNDRLGVLLVNQVRIESEII